MTTTYTLLSRDPSGTIDGQVADFALFTITDRAADVGTFELRLPWDHPARARLWQDGAGVALERTVDGTTVTVASGPIRRRSETYSAATGRLAVLYGVTDLAWLARRLTHPSPATAPGAGTYTPAVDARTGIAETVIKAYVNVNAGPGAIAARRVAGLTIATDLARGATVTVQARWTNLLALTRDLAARAGYGLQCNGLAFDLRVPVDRAALGVEFSLDRGNLTAYTLTRAAPGASYIYAGGSGTGTGRTIREGQDAAAALGWGRAETFLDRRDTATTADLDGALTAALDEQAGTAGATLTVVDTPTTRYGADYELGDLVAVRIGDDELIDTIDELTISITGEATTVTPVVGDGTLRAGALAGFFARIARLEADIRFLEATQ